MSDQDCDCCGEAPTRSNANARTATDDRILDEPVLEADLPPDLQRALRGLVGGDSVETLGEWAAAIRDRVGGSIAVEDLCHADAETGHVGIVDGERYPFLCFYDAVALAVLVDRPVAIRTESPDGTVVEGRATPDGRLSTDREDAVFSFGVDETAAPAGATTRESVYAAICPYVKAFPDRAAYEAWAATVPAATVAAPLSDATGLAEALIG